jgi:hypothetical protein
MGVGLGVPLATALLVVTFLWRRARRDAAAARAELAELKQNYQTHSHSAHPSFHQHHGHPLLHSSTFSSSPTAAPSRQQLPPLYVTGVAGEKPSLHEAQDSGQAAIHQLPGTAEEMSQLVHEAPSSPQVSSPVISNAVPHDPHAPHEPSLNSMSSPTLGYI